MVKSKHISTVPAVAIAQQPAESEEKVYSIGMVGDAGVGKASLCVEFTKSKKVRVSRPSAYDPTDESRFYQTISIDDSNVTVQLISTSGQELMTAVEDIYFKKCLGFLLIFSVDNRSSFINATTRHFEKILRMKDCAQSEDIPHNIPMILVGNKIDLDPSKVQVTNQEIELFCQRNFIKYVATSTVTNENIYESFEMIVRQVVECDYIESMKKILESNQENEKKKTKKKLSCVIL